MTARPRKRKKNKPKGLRIILYSVIIALVLVTILLVLPRDKEEKLAINPSATATPIPYIDVPEETIEPRQTPANDKSKPLDDPLPQKEKNRLAIVFDDTGNSLADLKLLLDLPYPMTFAVLPGLANSRSASIKAHKAGKEVILHQPMESLGGENMGPGGIDTTMAVWKMQAVLTDNLDSIEYERGINNHMGSRATADVIVMDAVMEVLESRHLFFLDSRTTSETLAKDSARRFQVPFLQRSVFWDNETNKAYLKEQWEKAVELSKNQGQAILIGHAHNAAKIAEVLKENYQKASRYLDLVYLSDLLGDNR
ncbi:MAG: divergent polysaccharide deacetylase family protein [Spirochaetales bacterium]|nr:divergent polysaccharide deacetylase family protein [Spirochaetales bacterium]